MTFPEIADRLTAQFGPDSFTFNTTNFQPYVTTTTDRLVAVCRYLRDDEHLFFDQLACLTAIDNGPAAGTLEVVYQFTSIPHEHNLMLKVIVPRHPPENSGPTSWLPSVPSVASVWRTADWHEREAYDLVGIYFVGHPDLRRILLPTDWVGHPLRLDYVEEAQYHGIQTK